MMAKIDDVFVLMLKLEFNDASNALHKNPTEDGYTYMGIYHTAHPKWEGWKIVEEVIASSSSIQEASKKLFRDGKMTELVKKFYEDMFWNKMRLGEVVSQKIANEMFVFGVNAGIPRAVKVAQEIVGVSVDGVIGSKTVAALNRFDESVFDRVFDEKEIKFYERLVEVDPKKKIYMNGWRNRALAV